MSRFREDVFSDGEVGGHCDFKRHLHKDQGKNKSPLQSWWVYCKCAAKTISEIFDIT